MIYQSDFTSQLVPISHLQKARLPRADRSQHHGQVRSTLALHGPWIFFWSASLLRSQSLGEKEYKKQRMSTKSNYGFIYYSKITDVHLP